MRKITPLKAIRLKCLDCTCNQAKEVTLCTATDCPLYAFRSGHRPQQYNFIAEDADIKKPPVQRPKRAVEKGDDL